MILNCINTFQWRGASSLLILCKESWQFFVRVKQTWFDVKLLLPACLPNVYFMSRYVGLRDATPTMMDVHGYLVHCLYTDMMEFRSLLTLYSLYCCPSQGDPMLNYYIFISPKNLRNTFSLFLILVYLQLKYLWLILGALVLQGNGHPCRSTLFFLSPTLRSISVLSRGFAWRDYNSTSSMSMFSL